jgi:phosphoribosylformylglycinamidine cyclo-ligase
MASYKSSGVDYDLLDQFKREAQKAAAKTSINRKYGFKVVVGSRGESAFLIEGSDSFFAGVEEGLGTKNLVTDAMYKLFGEPNYEKVSQDCVAMIVNDLATLGAMPLFVNMHLAVGSSDWFTQKAKSQGLIAGWKKGCDLSRCAWGGGETPTLKEIVYPNTFVLSGSAFGIIKPKDRLIDSKNIKAGDAIVLIKSSGIHANGLTLARNIANKLTSSKGVILSGFCEQTNDGRTFGESLLDPTIIYVPLVDDCLDNGVKIHYAVNITGHGWRKLMRAETDFSYVIDKIFEPQPVFRFIQEHGSVAIREMYANFNMGAGFALYVDKSDVQSVIDAAAFLGMEAIEAGYVEEAKENKKRVVINPINVEFKGSSLKVR